MSYANGEARKKEELADFVAGLREGLVREENSERSIKSILPGRRENFSIEKNKAEIDAILPDLAQFMTVPVEPVPSPHPVLGPVKSWFKLLVLRMLHPFISMTLAEQVTFNENTYESIRRLHESVEYLRQEVEFVNKKVDAWRLKQDDSSKS